MKKTILFSFILFGLATATVAQNLDIPDANFKTYLLGLNGLDVNDDDTIQISEARNYGGDINCANLGINDLTGIDAFLNLHKLNCSGNNLTQLLLGDKSRLFELHCQNNKIENLIIFNHNSLWHVEAQRNQLTKIDLLMGQPFMQLKTLNVEDNLIDTINLNNCTQLEKLKCGKNKLTELVTTKQSNLIELQCSGNKLTSLDVSTNTKLTLIETNFNELNSLNVANGNNKNFQTFTIPPVGPTLHLFSATDNPNLTCVQVDDASYSTTTWPDAIPAAASYSENCSGNASIPEKVISFNVYPNPTSSFINLKYDKPFNQIEVLDVTGKTVKTFTQTASRLSVADLPSGLYTLQIIGDSEVGYSKFIKN